MGFGFHLIEKKIDPHIRSRAGKIKRSGQAVGV